MKQRIRSKDLYGEDMDRPAASSKKNIGAFGALVKDLLSIVG